MPRNKRRNFPIPTDAADVQELWSRLQRGRRDGHYYAALFGLRRYDTSYVIDVIRKGIPTANFLRFLGNTGLSSAALADFVDVSERTLARRRSTGRLNPQESDRVLRTARVFARAIELFEGDADAARLWLTRAQRALGDASPLDFARTDVGTLEVDGLIGRLENGHPT